MRGSVCGLTPGMRDVSSLWVCGMRCGQGDTGDRSTQDMRGDMAVVVVVCLNAGAAPVQPASVPKA